MSRGQWTQGGGGGLDTGEVTATVDKVLKGYTAGVKDSDEPQEGTLEVQSIVNFRIALYGTLALTGTWQNPAAGPYSGVTIRYKTGGYPNNIEDGELAYEGSDNSFSVGGLIDGATYYFRAWSYATTNFGKLYSNNYLDAEAVAQIVKGNQSFTGSTSWIVPEGVRMIDVFCVGGGGSGGSSGYYDNISKCHGGGGGGSGYTNTSKNVSVNAGDIIAVNIAGQSGTTSAVRSGVTLCSAGGGGRGADGDWKEGYAAGGGGGSPGGSNYGGNGYSDGKLGQGRTTRAFGETTGTLYAGGGGGGSSGKAMGGGSGGAGGGGAGGYGSPAGGWGYAPGQNGTANTGSGGGGAGGSSGQYSGRSGAGASGIVLIRWGF